MTNPIIQNRDIQRLITKFELIAQENKALRRYIGELEERLGLEKQLRAVKIGGFNYHCVSCKEKFDVPGHYTTCPYCKSIKIRVIDKTLIGDFFQAFLDDINTGQEKEDEDSGEPA